VGDPDGEGLFGTWRRHDGRLTTWPARFDAVGARPVNGAMLLFERIPSVLL